MPVHAIFRPCIAGQVDISTLIASGQAEPSLKMGDRALKTRNILRLL
jgi:hypothetical protein